MHLDHNGQLVRGKLYLDLSEFILYILWLVLLLDVLAIESIDVTFDQLQTVQLIVWSVLRLLDKVETLLREYLIDLSLLIVCLEFYIQVQVNQGLSADLSHFLDLALNGNGPESVNALKLI